MRSINNAVFIGLRVISVVLMFSGALFPNLAYSQAADEVRTTAPGSANTSATGTGVVMGTAPPALSAMYLAQLTGALLVVIITILALGWFMRRTVAGPSSFNQELRILGGLAVGARERILLVQVGEQQILIGVGPGYMRTLHVLPEPLRGAAQPALNAESPFLRQLRTLMKSGSRHAG